MDESLAEKANVSYVDEHLDDKMDAVVPHIVEVWTDGLSGYRLWSNNWCEQWGFVEYGSAGTNKWVATTIPMLREMADTNYNVIANCNWKGGAGIGCSVNGTTGVALTSFEVGGWTSTTNSQMNNIRWRVEGFAKEE